MTRLTDETKADLIDSLNRVNDSRLEKDMLLFSAASPSTGPLNTEFNLSVIGGFGYEGSTTCYYHRLDLADLYNVIVTSLKAKPIATTYDILPDINRICKLTLDEADIVNETLNLKGVPGETFTLKAAEQSNRYTGELTFTLTYTSSYLIRGRFRHTAGSTYKAMLPGNIDGFNHRLFTLYIDGVYHPIAANGTFTSSLPGGEYEFSLNTPLPRGFCSQTPVVHVSSMIDFSGTGSFGHCFDGSRTLETIGDDVFSGNLTILSLSSTFANCSALRSAGRNLLANPDGYRSLEYLFYNCPKLETIGETEVYTQSGGQALIGSSLYNCRKLQKVPDNWTAHSQFTRDVSFIFYYVGYDLDDGCVLPKGLFDGFNYLSIVQSAFSYAKIKSWPTEIFTRLPVVLNARTCFKGSNLDRLEPDMFGTYNSTLSGYGAFSDLMNPIDVPAYLLGSRGPVDATELFARTTIKTMEENVLKGAFCNSVERMFMGATLPTTGMPNIFNEQYSLTSLGGLFASARLTLTAANRTLFTSLTRVTNINTLFQNTQFYKGVFPVDLLLPMSLVTDIGAAFAGCIGADEPVVIPSGLFDNQNNVTSFARVFENARNIRFEGSVFPTRRSARNISQFFGTAPSNIGYRADFGRYTENVLDASYLFAFPNAYGSDYPYGLLEHFVSCTTMDSLFRTSNYTRFPYDMFRTCTVVKSLVRAFMGMPDITLEPNIFDPLVELTNAANLFEESYRLTLPDNLFERCLKISNLNGLFYGATFTQMPNRLLGYTNPASPTISSMFMKGGWTSVGVKENRLGVPIAHSLQWFMYYTTQSDHASKITVRDFLDYVGFGPLGKLGDDPSQWTEMFQGVSAITGSKQLLYIGLWQVESIRDLPTGAPGDICRYSSTLF